MAVGGGGARFGKVFPVNTWLSFLCSGAWARSFVSKTDTNHYVNADCGCRVLVKFSMGSPDGKVALQSVVGSLMNTSVYSSLLETVEHGL